MKTEKLNNAGKVEVQTRRKLIASMKQMVSTLEEISELNSKSNRPINLVNELTEGTFSTKDYVLRAEDTNEPFIVQMAKVRQNITSLKRQVLRLENLTED